MKISQHYKFRLLPNQEQEILLNQAIGSARFVWNQVLAKSFEMFAKNERIPFCLWREDAVKVALRSRKQAKSVRKSPKSICF